MHSFNAQKILAFVAVFALLFIPSISFAQELYERLVFLPVVDQTTPTGAPDSIATLLNGLFQLSISIGSILAVIMIAVGGVEYMGSDAISSKSAGRERMFNAVLGLVLILGTYIILSTINPKLLSFQIFTPLYQVQSTPQSPINAATPPTGGATEGTPAGPSG